MIEGPDSKQWRSRHTSVSVYDGDTLRLHYGSGRHELLRVKGVDTPEINGRQKCQKELLLGLKAKNFVKDGVAQSKVTFRIDDKTDKYGRLLGVVYLDGRNLTDMLIDKGLGRKYAGEKRKGWCDE